MGGNALFTTDVTKRFAGGGLDTDGVHRDLQERCHGGTHRWDMGHDLRTFQDQRTVHVAYGPPFFIQQPDNPCEQELAIGTLPCRVGIREVLADITQGSCTEQGIAHGMQEHIRIGMAQSTGRMGDTNASEPELTTFDKTVDIKAEADPDHPSVEGFFLPLSNLNPRVKRNVLANGLRWVLAIK